MGQRTHPVWRQAISTYYHLHLLRSGRDWEPLFLPSLPSSLICPQSATRRAMCLWTTYSSIASFAVLELHMIRSRDNHFGSLKVGSVQHLLYKWLTVFSRTSKTTRWCYFDTPQQGSTHLHNTKTHRQRSLRFKIDMKCTWYPARTVEWMISWDELLITIISP